MDRKDIMGIKEAPVSVPTSAGQLGTRDRQEHRLIRNPHVPYSDTHRDPVGFFRRHWGILTQVGQNRTQAVTGTDGLVSHEPVTRTVLRTSVSDRVLEDILSNGLKSDLEVAVDISDFTGETHPDWFIYMAKNQAGRDKPAVPIEQMIAETEGGFRPITSPRERVLEAINKGGTFIDSFSEEQIPQVFSLWQKAFGWTEQEVRTFRDNLEVDKQKPLSQRDMWFSAVMMDGKIVTASMAECLPIRTLDGEEKKLWELTEWVADPDYRDRHLMTATIDMLNAQVIKGSREAENGTDPFIYAEVNHHTHAERVAHGAGLVIPERHIKGAIVNQILVKNVSVGNGDPGMPLRDFHFVYLPKAEINTAYTPDEIEIMLSKISTR